MGGRHWLGTFWNNGDREGPTCSVSVGCCAVWSPGSCTCKHYVRRARDCRGQSKPHGVGKTLRGVGIGHVTNGPSMGLDQLSELVQKMHARSFPRPGTQAQDSTC